MKTKFLEKLVAAFTGLVLGISIASVASAYDFESYSEADSPETATIEAFGTDTVAGYTTLLKSSDVGAGTNVVFRVEKPDHSYVELPAVAGLNGLATIEFFEFHTRTAGEYKVSARFNNSAKYSSATSFFVLPGEVSEIYSEITPTEQVVRIGRELGEIEVMLKDVFGNPINGHMVELISSRNNDQIASSADLSDSSGRTIFSLGSNESGVSTYTVYDLTSNKVLSTRAKVVYFESNEEIFGDAQAYVVHASGSASGPAAYLSFEDFPESVTAGDSVSFELTAMDESNQVVTDYEGSVEFAVVSGEETSVDLPSDYTFVPEDLGNHEFALALSFTSPGSYTIEARDSADNAIFGTVPVTVVAGSGSVSDLISITNPTAGTYSNNVQVVSGKSTPGATLAIYDNNEEMGNVSADTTGNFMFTSGLLDDGSHEIYVAIVNEAGTITASSSKISLKIDTTAPEVSSVQVSPSEFANFGADLEVKVYAESGLPQVTLNVNGNVYEMEDSESGYYTAAFKAPATQGVYPVKITLVDALGNQSKVEDQATITVGSGTGFMGQGTGEQVGDVSGVVAYPGDHKVTLSWIPPSGGGAVQFYRIHYGLSPNQLQFAVDTWDATNTWYISDLKNASEYYFAVTAVDNYGNSSALMSNIVSAIPGTVIDTNVLPPDVWSGTAGAEQLQDMENDVSETGPEALWLFLAAIFGGLFYSYSSSKKTSEEYVDFQ